MESLKMNNGLTIPQFGIGVFRLSPEEAEFAVKTALANGYRHIDTANFYMNERAVGRGIKASGLKREEIFLTSKVFPGYYKKIPEVVEATLKRLDTPYLDLFLLHQPYGDIKKAWLDLEEMVRQGKIKSIGVSNFPAKLVDKMMEYATIKPVVNQVECHPYYAQDELRAHHDKLGIKLEAWYPLGSMNKKLINEPLWEELAKKYGKSKVQIILRWHIQKGNIVIPGSKNEAHIKSNIDIFDFALTEEEMAKIAKLDKHKKFLPIPRWLGSLFLPLIRMNFDKQK